MSKIVKGIKRVVKKVWSGAKKLVKKVWDNPIGRIVATSALTFFGVPAVAGLAGKGAAAATGASGLSGAVKNIGHAWNGLTTAASSAVGGNFSQAGQALKAGYGGTAIPGSGVQSTQTGLGVTPGVQGVGQSVGQGVQQGVPLGQASAGMPTTGFQPMGGAGSASSGAAQGAGNVASGAAQGAGGASGGLLNPNMGMYAPGRMTEVASSAVNFGGQEAAKQGLLSRALGAAVDSPYTMPTAMMMGGNMLSNVFAQREAERQARDERNRYNTNIGTPLWR